MRQPLRTTATALSIAALLALLELFRTTLTRILEGNPATGPEFLHRVIPMWVTVVIASPWCAFMTSRFPFRPGRTARTLFAHFGGAGVFVALHLSLILLFHWVMANARFGSNAIVDLPTGHRLLHMYAFYVGMEMSVYAAIVMVLLLLQARREAAEREVATARLAQSVTAARLESLQAQIHPHFLFNTLNTLAVLARRGDGPAVDRAIGDLGAMLRASFESPGRHELSLAEEIAFVERYLSLQRLRFPDRLAVDLQIDAETLDARVPALLVQPLVENALEHGLATARGGRLRISARRDAGVLQIEVADDGPGFGAAMAADASGIGLANIRERLQLLYGAAGELTCGDAPAGGGRVRVRIPWRTVDRTEIAT
ncbi:MAG: sensor histidine kinase [Candidatus Eisenbacteria bacterium]|uniref:Sensor histidine kinase n=1 Tax=Eiseniibacteriota bacterium TaxID=2212470 RepID=A0A849SMT6_UNCEI|nr:sensor histidine kinase [Candidatus Eisenbacteria bacterium]